MSRPPAGNVFELFSITEPGRPKAKSRNTVDPEAKDRKRRIEIIQEKRDQEKSDCEVWDEG